MKKRTTTVDVLRFAWILWRSPHRSSMRIGQMLENAVGMYPNRAPGSPHLFYIENKQLLWVVKNFWW